MKTELFIAAVAMFAPSACLAQGYIISTVAGGAAYSIFPGIGIGNGQQATNAYLNAPAGVAVDKAGNIYIADTGNNEVRKVSAATGIVSAFAGSTNGGFSGDGGAATSALLHGPTAVALDSSGNVYVADTSNNRIRMVNSNGVITTVAGSGGGLNTTLIGDGGLATSATLNSPRGVLVDSSGNLYIADSGNNRVRKVTASNGIINTIAGNGSTGMVGMVGDSGLATNASLSVPVGVALDSSGNLYIGDSGDNLIRKVTASTGIITSIAGNGESGSMQLDGNIAIYTQLNQPQGVAVDGSGNVFFADTNNEIIREVTPAGTIGTIAGNQGVGDNGDGGPAGAASLDTPIGIALTSTGLIYIANSASGYQDSRIRVLTPSSGAVPTITPNGIVSVDSSFPIVSPNSWISIYGTNLASGTAVWNGTTFPIPTTLGGVAVTIDSLPANLWYVSSTQINAQVPNDIANSGTVVPVSVSTGGGTATANVSLGAVAPSFNLFSGKYPAAVVFTPGKPGNSGLGFDYIGPSGAFSFPSRPVMPGEVVVLYGTGFGPTNPTVAAGQPLPASGAAPLGTLPTINIGTPPQAATINFGGVVAPGLYQFNVVVPTVTGGDNLLQALFPVTNPSTGATSSYTTQNNIYLTVQ